MTKCFADFLHINSTGQTFGFTSFQLQKISKKLQLIKSSSRKNLLKVTLFTFIEIPYLQCLTQSKSKCYIIFNLIEGTMLASVLTKCMPKIFLFSEPFFFFLKNVCFWMWIAVSEL
jgi:hypothetical protein